MEKDIRIKELETEVQYLKARIRDLEKDKAYLQDQVELKLISIDTSTTFIKQMFTTPDKKTKPKTKVQISKEDEIREFQAFLLKKGMKGKL